MNYAVVKPGPYPWVITPVDWQQAESLKARKVPVFKSARQAHVVAKKLNRKGAETC